MQHNNSVSDEIDEIKLAQRQEIIRIVSKAIQDDIITIKELFNEIIPKKVKKTKDMGAYMKNYYEKNKQYLIQKVLSNRIKRIEKAKAMKSQDEESVGCAEQIVPPEL